MAADDVAISRLRRYAVDDPAFAHHEDAVGDLEDLVEIVADKQNCGTAVRRRDDLRVDLGDRLEVEAEARIGNYDETGSPGQLAGEDGALDIAAGERGDRSILGGRLDLSRRRSLSPTAEMWPTVPAARK